MPADDAMDNARAAAEAREALARRGGRGPGQAEDAMKRYLASESFRERRREERDGEDAVSDAVSDDVSDDVDEDET